MSPAARARRWFWGLVLLATLAAGTLVRAVQAPTGLGAALTLLVAGVVLTLSLAQAVRVLRALNGPLVLDLRRLYQDPDRR